jgi:hypothetical protein
MAVRPSSLVIPSDAKGFGPAKWFRRPEVLRAVLAGSRFVFLFVAAALGSGGCYSATGPAGDDTVAQEQFWTTQPEDVRVEAMRRETAETCPLADPAEVAAVAEASVRYGELLRHEYELTRPVEYNNLAIWLGLKNKRGRCFELADDLYIRLRALRLRTLQLHRAIAKEGHPIDEHNVVIVTDAGKPIDTGIVVDLWRYAGKVRFIAVARDTGHQWTERPITATPPAELVIDDLTPGRAATP